MDFLADIMQSLAPPPLLKVSEHADKFRVLSPEASSEAGRWRTSRAEYQRDIMDAVNDPDIEEIVFIKPTQVGATEIINNILHYHIKLDPCPILVVQPTVDMGQIFSKDRLAPMLRDCEDLKDLVADAKAKDSKNTIMRKTFPGGDVAIVGANSPVGLASRPRRMVLIDELDRCKASAGAEGDPATIAFRRTETFWNRLHVMVSSPTIKDLSRIEAAYLESDRRQFWVPCPFCQKEQLLIWDNVRWDKGPAGEHLTKTTKYKCEHCRELWTDARRNTAVRRGRWIPERPKNGIAGFRLNSLYSPWVKLKNAADNFLKSKPHRERYKVFVNTVLGETFEDTAARVEPDLLFKRRYKYPAQVPAAALVITAGVDVQADRFEITVAAHAPENETFVIEHVAIYGDLEKPEVWQELDDKLKGTYLHESGLYFKVSCVCIDSGDNTDKVYRFCKGKQTRRVFAVKGASTAGLPLVNKPSKNNRYKIPVFLLGVDGAKSSLYHRLKIDEPGAGYVHFSESLDLEYFKQLAAEKAQIKYSKAGVASVMWIKTRPRNEALDCFNYLMAALRILNPNFPAIKRNIEKALELPPSESAPPADKKKGKKGPAGKSWVNNY